MPPRAGPTANPTDVAAVRTPNERPSTFAGMNFTQIIGAHAIIIEAPRPCRRRAAISIGSDTEIPHTADAAVNSTKPAIRVFLICPREATLPKIRIVPATISR